jgi:hypothetical protein
MIKFSSESMHVFEKVPLNAMATYYYSAVATAVTSLHCGRDHCIRDICRQYDVGLQFAQGSADRPDAPEASSRFAMDGNRAMVRVRCKISRWNVMIGSGY